MQPVEKAPMLKVLEDLAMSPHWDSIEWTKAVTLAIREAIKETVGKDPNLATRLMWAEAALDTPEREQALYVALSSRLVGEDTAKMRKLNGSKRTVS